MIGYSSAALLLELHGLEPPLHHHPISHDTNGEPPSLSHARRQISPFRPWRSTSGVRRPRLSPASGYTRTYTHIHDHAKTAPPAPHSAPESQRRSPPDRRHGRIKPPPWPKPPGALEVPSTCPTSPLEHRDAHTHHMSGFCCCHRAIPVRHRARAADRRGQRPGKPRPPPRPHHRVAMAWGSYSPPQLDTSTAMGARR